MAVTYTNAVKQARLQAVIDAIGTAGVLEIGTAGMASILATIPLANPAGTASNGTLTFTMPRSDTSADASGTAAAARIRTGGAVDVVTGLTVGQGSGDISLDSVNISAGQTVTINSASITHA